MKVVIQRVSKSSVTVNSEVIARIGKGLNLLVCIEKGDTELIISKAATKVLSLRVFSDENGKMNKNISQVSGSILAVSQFTLSWDGRKGNRPSFDRSATPEIALELFNKFVEKLSNEVSTKVGAFGENMAIEISNDGPVTFSFEF